MSNIRRQLKNLDVSKLRMKNGRSVADELKHHASILSDLIMEEMDNSIYSYQNKVYRRTFDLWNSVYIENNVRVDVSGRGTSLSISVKFSDEVMHENFEGERMNIAEILHEGYQTHGSFSDVPMLGWRNATKFVEKAIEKYKQRVSNPFTVRFTINNEERLF